MYVKVEEEFGVMQALKGLSFNKKQPEHKMFKVLDKLAQMDGGHNKALESIVVYLNVQAPLYWWKQFDTYRIGITKQSESTMHTLLRTPLTQDNFEDSIPTYYLALLNHLIEDKQFDRLNNLLPSGFLQKRLICTNYKALRGIYQQRKHHKLAEWRMFCNKLVEELNFPQWIKLKEEV